MRKFVVTNTEVTSVLGVFVGLDEPRRRFVADGTNKSYLVFCASDEADGYPTDPGVSPIVDADARVRKVLWDRADAAALRGLTIAGPIERFNPWASAQA